MRILIAAILSLSLFLLCNTPQEGEIDKKNSTEMEKKNIGSLLALYPKPMTVVGAEVKGKVNWLVVGHTGIIGHDRILVSMSQKPLYQSRNKGFQKTFYQPCQPRDASQG